MTEISEEFGRKTVLATTAVLDTFGHAQITRFLLSHGLENSEANHGQSLRDRTNSILRFLFSNPGRLGNEGITVRSEIVRDLVGIAIERAEGESGRDIEGFASAFPELASALAADGFLVRNRSLEPFERPAVAMSAEGHEEVDTKVIANLYARHGFPEAAARVSASAPLTPLTQMKPPALSVFISHSSNDRNFVVLLIHLLRSALNIPAEEIRCTSVDGYRLPAGANAAEQLRREN